MGSNELSILKDFEDEIWRRFNGLPATAVLPDVLNNRLKGAWDRLPPNEQRRVARSANEFLTRQANYKAAERYVELAEDYAGSVNDDDEYGNELERSDFEEYFTSKRNSLNVLKTFYDSIKTMQKDRRVLGLPPDDYGTKILDMWTDLFEVRVSTSQDEFNMLPKERRAVKQRLSERKRIAEGGLGPLWEGKWPLGEGTFGTAALFVKQNAAGRVADHVVIKETRHDNHAYIWALKELWTGWGGPDDLNSIPNEVQTMYNLSDKAGSENILGIRNWRIRRAEMYHRLYLEFCPRGDLFDFCCGEEEDPYSGGAHKRKMFPDNDWGTTVDLVPEPFLWSVFWSLASAGLLMERGRLEQDGENDEAWEVIIHRDLKLSNVFLSWHNAERFKAYPAVKVADFGLSLMMPPDNFRIAEEYQHHGTPGNRAPEHSKLIRVDGGDAKMMTSKTNVWSVGIVLWSMITCLEGLDEPFKTWSEVKEIPELDLTARAHYSEQLISLIYRCLRFNDEERPTFDELMDEIKQCTGDGPFDFAGGLRDAPLGDPRWNQHKLHIEPAKWRRNVLLKTIPRPGGEPYPAPPPAGIPLPGDDFGGTPGAEVVGSVSTGPMPFGGGIPSVSAGAGASS